MLRWRIPGEASTSDGSVSPPAAINAPINRLRSPEWLVRERSPEAPLEPIDEQTPGLKLVAPAREMRYYLPARSGGLAVAAVVKRGGVLPDGIVAA